MVASCGMSSYRSGHHTIGSFQSTVIDVENVAFNEEIRLHVTYKGVCFNECRHPIIFWWIAATVNYAHYIQFLLYFHHTYCIIFFRFGGILSGYNTWASLVWLMQSNDVRCFWNQCIYNNWWKYYQFKTNDRLVRST